MEIKELFHTIIRNRVSPVLLVPLTSSLFMSVGSQILSILNGDFTINLQWFPIIFLTASVITIVAFIPILLLFKLFRINLKFLLLVAVLVCGKLYIMSPVYYVSVKEAYSCAMDSDTHCDTNNDTEFEIFVKSSALNPAFWLIILSGISGTLAYLYASKINSR